MLGREKEFGILNYLIIRKKKDGAHPCWYLFNKEKCCLSILM